MLVVDITAPERVRAYARFDAARVAAAVANNEAASGALLGNGHLAMTIEARAPTRPATRASSRSTGERLEDAAHRYFRAIGADPVAAAARRRRGSCRPAAGRRNWRAGGLLVQFLPPSAARAARSRSRSGRRAGGHASATRSPRTMPGSRRRRWSRPSRITNCSIRRCRASGCSTGCSTSAACACSARSR